MTGSKSDRVTVISTQRSHKRSPNEDYDGNHKSDGTKVYYSG